MLTKTFAQTDIFKKRREKLNSLTEESVFIFFSGSEGHLSQFRANSHFVYLTGFEEPESWAVIRTGKNSHFSLFVRDKDPALELWDGERYGPSLAKQEYQADATYPLASLEAELKTLLRGCSRIFFSLGENQDRDKIVLAARTQAQQLDRRSGRPPSAVYDPNEVLASMRVIKDSHEIRWMKEVCELSAITHKDVMKSVRPGMNERQVQALLLYGFYDQLAFSEAYSSIVATGTNATTLHYRANNCTLNDGDLLLIDAGAEKNYYRADITRTYPVNGRFTSVQKEFYQAVLDVQKTLIAMVKPGFSLLELQEKAFTLITEKLVDLKILTGKVSDLIASNAYQKYYPHYIGHYLGLDVHDTGYSRNGNNPVPFEPGMVITVEPGIYIPANDTSVPKEFRGLGVRIEDDVLVTSKFSEVMTSLAPKEISELEEIIGTLGSN